MKKCLAAVILAAAVVFLLASCGEKPGDAWQIQDSGAASTGTQSGPVIPTDMDLCAASSGYTMAETDSGYYLYAGELLYYADKSDLTKWVVVCNTANCAHDDSSLTCPARVGTSFYLENDRIWTVREPREMNSFAIENCVGVYSMALDGTDLRCEYTEENSALTSGSHAFFLVPGKVYGSYSILQNDGSYHNSVVMADASGTTVLQEGTSQDMKTCHMLSAWAMYQIRGDFTLLCNQWGEPENIMTQLLRVTEGGLEEVPGLTNFDMYGLVGACLQGSTLLHFVQDDGYYRTNLVDGTTEKVMDDQLSGSFAFCFDCGYLIEGNVFAGMKSDTPEIRIYNGVEWKPLVLPDDFQLSEEDSISPYAMSTEYIFFTVYRETRTETGIDTSTDLYIVPLDSENYTMTFCHTFEG